MSVLNKFLSRLRYETPLWRDIHAESVFRGEEETMSVKVRAERSVVLEEIFRGVERFPMIEVYVHGSWADDTLTPFSDLDDLIIIDRDALRKDKSACKNLIKWLHQVEKKFYRLDVLQHHGHWVIFKDQLNAVDQSYIPIGVLEGAVRLQGREVVTYGIDQSSTRKGLYRNITVTLNNIRHFGQKYENGTINTYEMKALIGSFLLMPAFMFQLNGREISKRKAIESKSMLFSPDTCQLLDKCSEIRTEWGRVFNRDRWAYALLKAMTFFMFDPFLYPKLAIRIAPVFPKSLFPVVEGSEIRKFITEVEIYADKK